MALTKDDKKWVAGAVRDGVVEALEQVVFPELMKIEKEIGDVRNEVGSLKGEVGSLRSEMQNMESRLTKRIDKLGEVITDTRTNHERRIRRLEDETGVEPESRLVF